MVLSDDVSSSGVVPPPSGFEELSLLLELLLSSSEVLLLTGASFEVLLEVLSVGLLFPVLPELVPLPLCVFEEVFEVDVVEEVVEVLLEVLDEVAPSVSSVLVTSGEGTIIIASSDDVVSLFSSKSGLAT